MVGDRYEIIRPIGKGAFGHTFVARDREVVDWITLTLTSLVTLGILPLTFSIMAKERRKRMRRFLELGILGMYRPEQDFDSVIVSD